MARRISRPSSTPHPSELRLPARRFPPNNTQAGRVDRNTPVVLDDLRVGLKKLGSHIKLRADDVGGGVCIQSHNDPTVLARKVDNLRVACSG